MKEKKFEIIKMLMDELQDSMSVNESDFDERLGRKKPNMEVLEVKPSEEPLEDDDLFADVEMDEDKELSPEEELKKRIAKLKE